MTKVFFVLFFLFSLGSISLGHAHKQQKSDEEGYLGALLETVGDVAHAAKGAFTSASKTVLGKRRHDTVADYFAYLGGQAHKAGQTTSDFISKNWAEIRSDLTDDEADEIMEHAEAAEYEEHYKHKDL